MPADESVPSPAPPKAPSLGGIQARLQDARAGPYAAWRAAYARDVAALLAALQGEEDAVRREP